MCDIINNGTLNILILISVEAFHSYTVIMLYPTVLPRTIIINNSEVLPAATTKMTVFWDVVTLYSLVTIYHSLL